MSNESQPVGAAAELPLVDADADEVADDQPTEAGAGRRAPRQTDLNSFRLNADGSIESAESSCANGIDTPPAELCQCEQLRLIGRLQVSQAGGVRRSALHRDRLHYA